MSDITIDDLTPAEKRAITAARKLREAQTSPTFPLGCKVKVTNRKVPKYDGKTGVVRAHNRLNGKLELGCSFGASEDPDAWFAPKELIRL